MNFAPSGDEWAYLGFREEEVGKEKGEEVPRSIKAEGALRLESPDQRGPCQAEDEVETPAGRGGKAHANVTDIQWECLCRISEWDRPLAWAVNDHEHVNARCNQSQTNVAFRCPEGEPGP